MKRLFIILLFNVICIIKMFSCDLNCNINVDSLFSTNLNDLSEMVGYSLKEVKIQERSKIEFLYVISLLSGNDFVLDPHNIVINDKTILAIEDWYWKKKKYITCDKVRRAYALLIPPLFKTFEESEEYSNELDQLKIKDE